MAKKLSDLKVNEIRQELEDRDLDTTGKKSVLLDRLKEALIEEGFDPETYLFVSEIAAQISTMKEEMGSMKDAISSDLSMKMASMEDKVSDKISSMENKISTDVSEKISSMKEEMESMKAAISSELSTKMAFMEDKISTMKGDISTEMTSLNEKITTEVNDKISSVKNEIEETIQEIKRQMAELRKSDTSRVEEEEPKPKMEILGHAARIKTPTFDGKTSWTNYLKQFETAARANEWSDKEKSVNLTMALRGEALDILQAIPVEELDDFETIKKRLNVRYGHEHLEHLYRSQLKNRKQRRDETLQEFEADISRLIRFAYPTAPDSLMESLAVQAFIDGLRDHDMQRTLRLAHYKTLVDVLAAALEYEAASQASGVFNKVRTIKEDEEDNKLDQVVSLLKDLRDKKTRSPRCWNCGEIGHIRSSCKRPRVTTNQTTNQQEN